MFASAGGAERHDDRFSLSYLCFPFTLDLLRQDQDPDVLPLQLALARYVQRYTTEPGLPQCRGCGAKQHVRSLHLPVTSWTWLEVRGGEQLILPSLDISYSPQDTRQTHPPGNHLPWGTTLHGSHARGSEHVVELRRYAAVR